MTSKEALNEIKKEINSTYFDENGKQWWTSDNDKDYRIKIIEKDLEEKEKQDLLLKSLRRNNCERVTPLSNIFQGLKQEEKYKYIEHIYYSYKELEEQKELLESELKLEKDKVKYVMGQLKKQDKVLEILKEYGYKKVFELEEVEDGGYISNREDSEFIPKEEFNLLKEVLDNGKD